MHIEVLEIQNSNLKQVREYIHYLKVFKMHNSMQSKAGEGVGTYLHVKVLERQYTKSQSSQGVHGFYCFSGEELPVSRGRGVHGDIYSCRTPVSGR